MDKGHEHTPVRRRPSRDRQTRKHAQANYHQRNPTHEDKEVTAAFHASQNSH